MSLPLLYPELECEICGRKIKWIYNLHRITANKREYVVCNVCFSKWSDWYDKCGLPRLMGRPEWSKKFDKEFKKFLAKHKKFIIMFT